MPRPIEHSNNLNLQQARIAKGYALAVILLVVVLLGAHVVLQSAQHKQASIESLLIVTRDLQFGIRDSFSRTSDLKESSNLPAVSERLIAKIKKKTQEDHNQILFLLKRLNDQIN